MISTIKLIYNKINIINQLTKIIDELQKDNKKLEEDFLVMRNRAQEAEAEQLRLERMMTDLRDLNKMKLAG